MAQAAPTYTFYSPMSPDENIIISGKNDPLKFKYGELNTQDDSVAALLRENGRGRFYEADLPFAAAPVCSECGRRVRNMTAFSLHVREHAERAASSR